MANWLFFLTKLGLPFHWIFIKSKSFIEEFDTYKNISLDIYLTCNFS